MSKKKRLAILEDQVDLLIERMDRVNEIIEGHEVSLHELHNQFLPSERNAGNTIADQMIKLTDKMRVVIDKCTYNTNHLTEASVNHENMRKDHENIRKDIRELVTRNGELDDRVDELTVTAQAHRAEIAELKPKQRPKKPIKPAKKKRRK